MRDGFDIAIIGGGVIGLSLARALGRACARVAVIDAGAEIPPATNAAAGMLAPSFECGGGVNEDLYAFSADSLSRWPSFAAGLEEEIGLDIDFRGGGILGVVYDEDALREMHEDCARLKKRGADVEMLSGKEARRLEPALSNDVIGGVVAHDDAQVDPRKALIALRASFEKRKGALIAGRVAGIEKTAAGFVLQISNGETLEASQIVLASGAAATAGLIEELPAPPIFSVKGDAVALSISDNLLQRVVRAPGAYLCPKAGGRLVIGASEAHGVEDLATDPTAVAALCRNGARAIPALESAPELERWAGLRPATPDSAPILGRDPRGPDNVFLALGHYRNGILLAPASADVLAGEILEETPGAAPFDLSPFRPDRFAETEETRRCG